MRNTVLKGTLVSWQERALGWYKKNNLWPTGNRLPRAFAARAPAKILRRNFLTCSKKRMTLWRRLSWLVFSKLRGKLAMQGSGTQPPPAGFGAQIGKPKRRKPRSGWVRFSHRRKWLNARTSL